MNDHIIKAAKAAGFSTIQFKGDVERIRAVHSNGSWVCCTDSVTALYAIAYRAGMERAAEICDNWMAPPYVGSVDNANLYHSATNDCADEIRRYAQNQPKNAHDGSVVSKN